MSEQPSDAELAMTELDVLRDLSLGRIADFYSVEEGDLRWYATCAAADWMLKEIEGQNFDRNGLVRRLAELHVSGIVFGLALARQRFVTCDTSPTR